MSVEGYTQNRAIWEAPSLVIQIPVQKQQEKCSNFITARSAKHCKPNLRQNQAVLYKMQCTVLMFSSTLFMSQVASNMGPRHKLLSDSRKQHRVVFHGCACLDILVYACLYIKHLENGIPTLFLAKHMCTLDLLQISSLPGISFVVNNNHACQILLSSLAASWAAFCRTSFVPVTSFLCSREAFTTCSTTRAGARRIYLLCLLTDQTSLQWLRNP